MPEVIDKEALEFITQFIGGTQSALIQNLFEWFYVTNPAMRNQFPFTRPEEHLPSWNDIIVGGISIGEALLGLGIEEDPLKLMERWDFKAKEQAKEFAKGLRKFGEGATLYSVPMLTQKTIVQNIPAKAPSETIVPTRIVHPVGRVTKL